MRNIVIILLIFITGLVQAENFKSQLDSASLYYSKGYYEKAASSYEAILASGYESAEVYYNLGNSYFKSNKLTLAILNYERAHRLAPDDGDIKFNLELSNKYITDKIEKLPDFFITEWIKSYMSVFSTDMWAYLSIGFFILCLILFSIYLFSRIIFMKKIAFWIAILFFIGSVKTYVISYLQKKEYFSNNYALVLTPVVTVKSSPDQAGTDLFVLHEGTKVMLDDSVNNWREIKTSDGNVGWVENKDIVII